MLGLQVWIKSSVRKMAAVQEQYVNLLIALQYTCDYDYGHR